MIKRLRTYLKKLYPLIHPYEKIFWLTAITEILSSALVQVGAAYFARELFNGVAAGDIHLVRYWSVVWVVSITFFLLVYLVNVYLKDRFDYLAHNALRKRLLGKILAAKRNGLDKYHSGDLMSRLNSDIPNAIGLLTNTSISLLTCILQATLMSIYVIWIHPILFVVAVASLPFAFLVSKVIGPKVRQVSKEVNERRAVINSDLQDVLRGIQVVKAYGLEHKQRDKHMSNRWYIIVRELKNTILNFFLEIGSGGASLIAQVVSVIIGGLLYISGRAPLGNVTALMFGINMLIAPLKMIPQHFARMESNISSADRFFEVYEIEQEDIFTGDVLTEEALGDIEFRNVDFGYETQTKVLENVSLKIQPGETHAFVGATGSGKSTIAKLILKLYQPDSGELLIEGKNLNIDDTRKIIAYVPQEPYLFSGTIKENISYGYPNASLEEIIKAAKIADAHDFIMELPDQYDSDLGEEGTMLSGGQRQRIAIARAILKKATIAIWDEATSSLDTISERNVQQMIDAAKDQTVILIAHRLSTVKNADAIHVIHEGQIIESGTHDELIQKKGYYYQLYQVAENTVPA